MKCKQSVLAATLVSVLVLATGCSLIDPPAVGPGAVSTGTSTARGESPPSSDPSVFKTKPPNDLAVSPLKRTFQSAGLTVTVQYSASPAVAKWTASGDKSIRVFLTVVNKSKPTRKIYMTRASVRVSQHDATGEIPGPDPLVDSANLNPGYLVTSPYTYNQSFAIPDLNDSTEAVVLDFKFETVTLVDQKAKDYTKQSATDAVRVAVNF
jgi:hypothetical protein